MGKFFSQCFRNSKKNRVIRILFDKIRPINKMYYSIKKEIVKKVLIHEPPYDNIMHDQIITAWWDPIRFATIALAINTIKNEKIEGNLVELGVFTGDSSKVIHLMAPEKNLYLFDTFEGFPKEFLEHEDNSFRFKNTNIEILKKNIGNSQNIIIKKGVFPDTTKGLENERFCFVSIDVDLYLSTLKGLDFFYDKISKGGFILIHDYNNPFESKRGVFRAVNKFFQDKPEKIIEIPDINGSVIIRKM